MDEFDSWYLDDSGALVTWLRKRERAHVELGSGWAHRDNAICEVLADRTQNAKKAV